MNKLFIVFFFWQISQAQNDLSKSNTKGNIVSIDYSIEVLFKNDNPNAYFYKQIIKQCNPFYSSCNSSIVRLDLETSNSFESIPHYFHEFDKNGHLIKFRNKSENNFTAVFFKEIKEIDKLPFPKYPNYLVNSPIAKPTKRFYKSEYGEQNFYSDFTSYEIKNQQLLKMIEFDTLIYHDKKIGKLNIVQTGYVYDSNGNVVKRTLKKKDDENDKGIAKNQFYQEQSFDDIKEEKSIFYYDKQNRIQKVQSFRNRKFHYQEFYFFNSEGKIASIERHGVFDSGYEKICKKRMIYTFDDKGNINKIEFYDNDFGIQLMNTYVFEYVYDDKENWSSAKLIADGNEIAVFKRVLNYYN